VVFWGAVALPQKRKTRQKADTTSEMKLAPRKLSSLRLAEKLNNVSEAGKLQGLPLDPAREQAKQRRAATRDCDRVLGCHQ
jgi:hypothetical protein